MSMSNPIEETEASPRINRSVLIAALMMLIVTVLGIFAVFRFVDQERQRDLQQWQIRLGIVADSRTVELRNWLDQNFAVFQDLADNASLQLYMTELVTAEGRAPDEAVQAGYLRNLLIATAERTGFSEPSAPERVNANVERIGSAGIALINNKGGMIVASPGMPPLSEKISLAIKKALTGERVLIDIYASPNGLPTIGFAQPLLAIQGEETSFIGAVIGLKVVDESFYNTLIQPGETLSEAEVYLVRSQGKTVEYVSSLDDGTPPLKRSMAQDTPELASAFGIKNPGGFAQKKDYGGKNVLVTSRAVKGTPWTLIRTVSQNEALSGTNQRQRTFIIVFVLIIIGISITIFAVWRHGSSLRATVAAEKYKNSSELFENLIQFNRLLTDCQPTQIVCVDGDNKVSFANRPFADNAGVEVKSIKGMPLSSVIGPFKADLYAKANKQVIETGERQSFVHNFEEEDGETVISVDHVQIPETKKGPPSALMVFHDLTDLTRERSLREDAMHQLIGTLVSVVDRRDPYSSFHSARVTEVSRAIAEDMDLDELAVETVVTAGSLMNLGKIFIPTELLTKTGKLSDEERSQLANSFVVSSELIKGVKFEGNVFETVRQIGEAWDGSGPLGLKEDDILITARVVAVANVFVGMVSPRAYRNAMTFDDASKILLEEAGNKFDRKPVMALINHLENHDGREKWTHYRERPDNI